MKRQHLYLCIIAFSQAILICLLFTSLNWTSPKWVAGRKLTQCLREDPSSTEQLIQSFGHYFKLSFLATSKSSCFNPGFPVIKINAGNEANAWIQFVHADWKDLPDYQHFIDGMQFSNSKYYPFYPAPNAKNTFYDAPSASYTAYWAPYTRWEAHVYALHVDKKNRTIRAVGGFKWGTHFSKTIPYRLYADAPVALDKQTWKEDVKIFKQGKFAYNDIT